MFDKNRQKIIGSFVRLLEYCEREGYRGWDPYDGLNSRLLKRIPILRNNRFFRLVWIQVFKRNPFNLRKLLGVKKDYNPKGLALFLSGYCKLYQLRPNESVKNRIVFLGQKLLELKSKGWSGACWGYNFDWQARAFFQPQYTPTVVASTYVGNALLDAYEIVKDARFLQAAVSIKEFILSDLNRTFGKNGEFAFSYSPLDRSQIFNASLLGSRLLSRIYAFTGESTILEPARSSIKFCVSHQQADGSWAYGTLPYHQWVDNFHTGFNLECLSEYEKYSRDTSFHENIKLGLQYYLDTFFTEEGIAKYYNNAIYPVDIHAPAQLVVTLARMGKLKQNHDLVTRVLLWTIENMQDDKGYFYYQKKKRYASKIPYMRWAQAWMFYALSLYLLETRELNSFAFDFSKMGVISGN